MTTQILPKELMLAQPVKYDEFRFRNHLSAALSLVTLASLYSKESSIYNGFFRNEDDKQLAYEILRYIIDREPNLPSGQMVRRYVILLNEAGFFG